MSETHQWRVHFERRTEYVYGRSLEEAVDTAIRRVRPIDGDLKVVELYTPPDSWGVCYVAPSIEGGGHEGDNK